MQAPEEPSHRRRYLDVAQDLLTSIGQGDYRPGDRLPAHTDIATRAKVSRATAREAFLALELIGAIEVRHGDGSFVSAIAPRVGVHGGSPLDSPPQELIESRLAIEPGVAALAAIAITPGGVARLQEHLDAQEALVADPSAVPRFVALGLDFHSALATSCGNSLLGDIVRQLVNVESHPLWALVNQQGVSTEQARRDQVREHSAILDAVRAGDAGAAERAMREHLGDLDRTIFGSSH